MMSTDNVGENDTGENSGAQSNRPVGEGVFGGTAEGSVSVDVVIAIGLLLLISISRDCFCWGGGIFVMVGRIISD